VNNPSSVFLNLLIRRWSPVDLADVVIALQPVVALMERFQSPTITKYYHHAIYAIVFSQSVLLLSC
jgi:hypothetical protein